MDTPSYPESILVERYELNGRHARTIVTMLASDWALLQIQLAAYDKCALHPAYSHIYMKPEAQLAHRMQVAMLADIEAVLSQLADQRPEVDCMAFIRYQKDAQTHMLAPMYDVDKAVKYRAALIDAWTRVSLKGETVTMDTDEGSHA